MARRYEINELLALRSSPLIEKPPNLPSAEEWMGPSNPDQRRTSNPRDPSSPTETNASHRRPSLFESRHISRSSNSADDIVLGPPKTAFASSRIAGKSSIDASDRSSKPPELNEPKNDRFSFRGKVLKDNTDSDKKAGTFVIRRGDREDLKDGRARRSFGTEEQDRKMRRNGEFDRWEGRDHHESRGNERPGREKDSCFPILRKDSHAARARLDGSWFRDDNGDGHDGENEKQPIRNREWRRDRHGPDRDWHRGSKLEEEPEWFDTAGPEESRRSHTQRDFERWKEKMKAGSAQAHEEEKKELPAERDADVAQKAEGRPTDGEIFSHSGTPFQPDATMERFFGLLSEKKIASAAASPTLADSAAREKMATRPGKASRFAGIFSPPLDTHVKEQERLVHPPAVANVSTSDADQEGFQRILQMLGGSKSRNVTPRNDQSQPQQLPPAQTEQGRPPLLHLNTDPSSRPEYVNLQDPPTSRSAGIPIEEAPQDYSKSDPQDSRAQLLRLMQQVRISPANNTVPAQGQPQSASIGPGLIGMPDALSHPPGIPPGQKGTGFFDEPSAANMTIPDARRPPIGYFDESLFSHGTQIPMTPGGNRIPQGQGHSGVGIGMQRPPGFEHVPPPGWASHQLPPPPGIPARGINPNFIPNTMPLHSGILPLSERQPHTRGPSSSGSAAFGPPPGMMPPPGYMNMNGLPPPGFPSMPPSRDTYVGPGHSGQGPFSSQPGLQVPAPSSRHLLEVFGQSNGDDHGALGSGQQR